MADIKTDCAIIGGRIAGLWLLNVLQARDLQVCDVPSISAALDESPVTGFRQRLPPMPSASVAREIRQSQCVVGGTWSRIPILLKTSQVSRPDPTIDARLM